jgi:large conductance mechanosensitive channel
MVQEFLKFLKEYGVVGLAIAVIIGGKLNDFVKAVVDDLLMPLLAPVLSAGGGDWRTATLDIGPVKLGVGHLLGATIDFLIVAAFVFVIAKKILGERDVSKK